MGPRFLSPHDQGTTSISPRVDVSYYNDSSYTTLNHNGISVFLGTVPAGMVLYHGTLSPDPALGPERLAFEIKHTEEFASPRRRHRCSRKPSPPIGGPEQLITANHHRHPPGR
jgi:hypothetical protein